jgi:hypothetical protein
MKDLFPESLQIAVVIELFCAWHVILMDYSAVI